MKKDKSRNKAQDNQRTNPQYKDSVFRMLFDDKEKLLELFNSLEGTEYQDPEAVTVETLRSTLGNRMMNDLAFMVEDRWILLTEHQSTMNRNMPLRMLLYLAREYEKILNLSELHWQRVLPVPTPHFYVLYNGEHPIPAEYEMRLSESFKVKEAHPMLELAVRVIDINSGSGSPALARSHTLWEYGEFVKKVRANIKLGMERDQAIEKAIKSCIREDILREFLQTHGTEVADTMFREYTMEEMLEIKEKEGREEGYKEGHEKGHTEGFKEGVKDGVMREREQTARAMLEKGMDPEVIREITGLSETEIHNLSREV